MVQSTQSFAVIFNLLIRQTCICLIAIYPLLSPRYAIYDNNLLLTFRVFTYVVYGKCHFPTYLIHDFYLSYFYATTFLSLVLISSINYDNENLLISSHFLENYTIN